MAEFLLFADVDWVKTIFAIIFGVAWLLSRFAKKEEPPAEAVPPRPARRPQRNRPQQAAQPQAVEELEQFMEGFKQKFGESREQPNAPAARSQVPQPRGRNSRRGNQGGRRGGPPPLAVQEPAAQSVKSRHLSSSLESRHGGTVHSNLERSHLESRVESRHVFSSLANRDAVQEASVVPAASADATGGNLSILDGPNTLPRAFLLSEVFGPPLSMRS